MTKKADPSLERIVAETKSGIRTAYLADRRPWIVGFSGGKDSTAVLQLTWETLADLPPEKRHKTVIVVSSDTWVDNPVMGQRVEASLVQINKAAAETGIPIVAKRVEPRVSESFWVSMLGHGYAAPSTRFRWCTERLKIRPMNRFILQYVARYGEVIVVLGVRSSESAVRSQVLSARKGTRDFFLKHGTLTNAFIYAPVRDFSSQQVLAYLASHRSPWAGDNSGLLELYGTSEENDRPFVFDESAGPTGSRFGCWNCTVVQNERSLHEMITSGAAWLKPLEELRDLLVATQNPEAKLQYRDYRRKDGRVWLKPDGQPVPGPYTLASCKHLLRRVLEIDRYLAANSPIPDFRAIRPEEIHEIRRVWRFERHEWEDWVPGLYRDVMGCDLDWAWEDNPRLGAMEKEVLDRVSAENGLSTGLLMELLDIEVETAGMARRSQVFQRIDRAFSKEWRSLAEVAADRQLMSQRDGESR